MNPFGSAQTMDLRTNSLGIPSPWGSWVSFGSITVPGEVLDTASAVAAAGGVAAAIAATAGLV